MKADSASYNEVVATYTHVLKLDSPHAADAIAEILSSYGSRAALRATLVITLLKKAVEKNHSVENLSISIPLIKDFPEARPLLEQAITSCLHAWGISYRESAWLESLSPSSAESESTPSGTVLPPTEQTEQQSPTSFC